MMLSSTMDFNRKNLTSWIRKNWRVLVLLAAAVIIAPAVVWIPEWQVNQVSGLSTEEWLGQVDGHRRTLIQSLGFLGALILVWLTLRRTSSTEKGVLTLEKGQTTERFTRAIDHLGSCNHAGKPSLEIRVGGIYALEQIALDSPQEYHATILEVLTAYVRENSPKPAKSAEDSRSLRIDIQAVSAVIRRRKNANLERGGLDLRDTGLSGADLSESDLSGASLSGANLSGADLSGANLSGASLREGNLTGASLQGANSSWADLSGVDLHGANLSEANLITADLSEANLSGADLNGADLFAALISGADLSSADLGGAHGLVQDQLDSAKGDENTILPDGLTRPEFWK